MSKTNFTEYSQRYSHVQMRRDDGVIELYLHSEGYSLVWGSSPHSQLGDCFDDVARDPENRVVILTGMGDSFIGSVDRSWVGKMTPSLWDEIYFNGKRLLTTLLNIEVPVIAAVNGPARIHAELAVLSDITLASTDTFFQDAPHFRNNVVPGDGVHIVWQRILGPNRGRYFLLTGQKIDASEALRLGVVNEVLPREELMGRARELAKKLCQQGDTTLRYTRVALTQDLKRAIVDHVGYGLALEGMGAYATWPEG
jgi:enoyl-CoA hydratase/carnithine racemase